MSELPIYNAEGKCAKCGGGAGGTVYVAEREYTWPGTDPTLPEHLQRTCQRCGYTWSEQLYQALFDPTRLDRCEFCAAEAEKEKAMARKTIRAKFTCNGVTKAVNFRKSGFVYTATFTPVTQGSDENTAFWEATPSGEIKLTSILEDAFEPGQSYYVDFTQADA